MPWHRTRNRQADATAYGADYRRNRDIAMERDRWRCQLRIAGVCIGAAAECDHIVSVAEGGSHHHTNLRAACKPCHAHRTGQQGGGARRNGGSGGSADPEPQPRTDWTRPASL